MNRGLGNLGNLRKCAAYFSKPSNFHRASVASIQPAHALIMNLEAKFVERDWIGVGKKYESIPPFVELQARACFAIPETSSTTLPATTLPVSEFISCTLPSVFPEAISTKVQMWFSQEPPSIAHEVFLLRPIPPQEFVTRLSEAVGQAWLDGAQSVIDHRFNDRLPLWAITYWKKAFKVQAVQSLWKRSVTWLEQEDKRQREKGAALDDLLAVRELLRTSVGWDSGMPHLNGMASTGNLSRFLGVRWLSDDNVNMMIEELVLDLQGQKERSHILLLSLNFPVTIGNIVPKLAQPPAAREKSFLGQIERQVSDGSLEKLYFPLHITKNHWIAGEINFKEKTFAFGEPSE